MNNPLNNNASIVNLLLLLVLASNVWIGVTVQQGLKGGSPSSAPVAAAPVASAVPAAAVPPADTNALAKNVKKPSSADYVRGPKNAAVTLIEYSDLECPFCKRAHPTVKQVLDAYPKDVNYIMRHFPLAFHQNAQKEAEAAECVGKLGGAEKYHAFVDAIFERGAAGGTGFALDKLAPLATELGVDGKKVQACMDSNEMAEKVKKDMAEGGQAGVNGTPGFILINNKSGEVVSISGAQPFESFKAGVDKLLAK